MEIGRSLGMTIHRFTRTNFANQATALERLSSGLRVNRAGDDAAGLSISETLSSQVRGSHQAIRNVQDGISLLRTAEGAFSSIHDVLQRMRELVVQGGNDTLTSADRAAIQGELEALKKQIDTTAYFTTFNGKTLLVSDNKTFQDLPLPYVYDGVTAAPIGAWSDANAAEARLIAAPGNTISGVTLSAFNDLKAQLTETMEGARRKVEAMTYNTGMDHTMIATTLELYFVIDPLNPASLTSSDANRMVINLYPFLGTGVPAANPDVTIQQAFAQAMSSTILNREEVYGSSSSNPADIGAFAALTGAYDNVRQMFTMGAGESYIGYGKPAAFSFDVLAADGGRQNSAWFYRYLLENYGQQAVDGFYETIITNDTGIKANIVTAMDTYLLGLTGEASRGALEATIDTWITAQSATGTGLNNSLANVAASPAAQLLDNTMVLQVGANANETMSLNLFAGSLGNLDFASMVQVSDAATAGRSIASLDRAISIVSQARAGLGTSENRLEHTLNRLSGYAEQSQAANSRIRDVDMAQEMTSQTRSQVLAQASLASLARLHSMQAEQVSGLLAGI